MAKTWENYEEVAKQILSQFAQELGIESVEGKQKVPGKISGTEWEIDFKGVVTDGSTFLVGECRRRSRRRPQEEVAGLAWKIQDTGAAGGILVTPLELQRGAKKVAKAANIISACLDPGSDPFQFVLRFLDKVKVGLKDEVGASDDLLVNLRRVDDSRGSQ